MPELPEVQTTVSGLSKTIVGKTIKDVWSDFHVNTAHTGRKNIKNKKYFDDFRKRTIGAKIIEVERRGKHIIINLSNNNSIIVHMKMTGHLMIGKYQFQKNTWVSVREGHLTDPFNKFLHLVITLSGGKHLVLSDMRKFASICIENTLEVKNYPGILELGPDPLKITAKEFIQRIKSKKNWPIKAALIDQSIVAGIGNIYSDEMLWASGVHPLSHSSRIPDQTLKAMFLKGKIILKKSIKLGGDSMSDYRNAFGEKGKFQNCHKAYGKKGERCTKKSCQNKKGAIIKGMVVKGRSAHFCPIHQIRY